MSYCNLYHFGVFLKIKMQTRPVKRNKYVCKNHTDVYVVEPFQKFCSICGTELKNIDFIKNEDYHPTYQVPNELIDNMSELTTTENDEYLVISNRNAGVITTYNFSFKDVNVDALIAEFKTKHSEYLEWLVSEKFDYTIECGVVEYLPR